MGMGGGGGEKITPPYFSKYLPPIQKGSLLVLAGPLTTHSTPVGI